MKWFPRISFMNIFVCRIRSFARGKGMGSRMSLSRIMVGWLVSVGKHRWVNLRYVVRSRVGAVLFVLVLWSWASWFRIVLCRVWSPLWWVSWVLGVPVGPLFPSFPRPPSRLVVVVS